MNKDIKYYIYLSKVKVDMLWEQLSQNDIEKISSELKINVGIFSGTMKSEPKDKNLYAKLSVVLTYLEDNGYVGTIKNPKAFFKATLPMTWKEVFDRPGEQKDPRIVLFSGVTIGPEIYVGLVGSSAHIIGMNNLEPTSLHYTQPSFWMEIVEKLSQPNEIEMERNSSAMGLNIMGNAHQEEYGNPKQNFEFVVKTLYSKNNIVIGTPIYVSEFGL